MWLSITLVVAAGTFFGGLLSIVAVATHPADKPRKRFRGPKWISWVHMGVACVSMVVACVYSSHAPRIVEDLETNAWLVLLGGSLPLGIIYRLAAVTKLDT